MAGAAVHLLPSSTPDFGLWAMLQHLVLYEAMCQELSWESKIQKNPSEQVCVFVEVWRVPMV